METVLVQITNSKAYKLLEDLEDLNIIKVKKSTQPQQKLSEKYVVNCLVILPINFRIM